MTITIRPAQEPDIEFLVAMNRLVHALHLAAAPAVFKPHDWGAVAELFRSRLEKPDVRVLIASVGEDPAGYAVAVVHEQAETALTLARRYLVLDEIGVSPAQRRQGVARALIEHMLAEARAQGICDVQLSTWSFNAEGQAAFEAVGFRPMTVRFQRSS